MGDVLNETDALAAVHAQIGDADRMCLDRALRDYRAAVLASVSNGDEMVRDAMRYRALRALCESSVGALVSVNEHRLYYDDQPPTDGVGAGCACYVQFYPDTPVGFCTIGGDTFDAMADAVVTARSDGGPTND